MPIASVLRMIYKLKSELSLRDLLKRRQHHTAKRCLVSNFFNLFNPSTTSTFRCPSNQ